MTEHHQRCLDAAKKYLPKPKLGERILFINGLVGLYGLKKTAAPDATGAAS